MKSIPTDIVPDRLMAEIHYYDPWNFCGMEKDEDWGKMQYFWGSVTICQAPTEIAPGRRGLHEGAIR